VLTGAIVLVHARVRGCSPLLRHPGHWLLLVSAIAPIGPAHLHSRNTTTAGQLIFESIGLLYPGPAAFVVFALILLSAAVAYAIAVRRSEMWRWKLLFAGLSVIEVSASLFYFILVIFGMGRWFWIHQSVASCGHDILLGWLAFASLLDLSHRQRRDWLHWTGVATYVASAVRPLVWRVSIRFLSL